MPHLHQWTDHSDRVSIRRQWHPTPVLLPGKSHGQRSLEGCSPWGCWGSDTTEWLHFHFSLSCIGDGNGNPLQGSCLENPRDGGAWWTAVYGVTQSRTRLKWLSSSSSSSSSKIYKDLHGETDRSIIIEGYFNASLTSVDRSFRQSVNKKTLTLNEISDQINLIDLYEYSIAHPVQQNTHFSKMHMEHSPG